MPRLSPRVRAMPGSGVRHVLEKALQRPDAIVLSVGEPAVEVPAPAREAGAQAWRDGFTRYTPNGGILPLRQAIVDKLARENAMSVDIERVWVTVGGTQALHTAMAAVLSPGDQVLVPDPGYTTFTMNAALLGATPVPYALAPERGFAPDVAAMAALIRPETRAIIVNTPSNPLGATFDRATLAEILELAIAHDLWIVSDEVYERFVWDGGEHTSIGSLPGADDRVLSVFSTSKTFAMTGVRVGWLVTPPGWSSVMLKLQETTVSCVNTPAQYAALAAITGPQDAVAAAARGYRENFLAAAELLDERGLRYLTPSGAFYLWVDVSHASGGDVAEWADRFLDEQAVAVAPGSAFGVQGEGWIRLSLASDRADLLEGVRRLPRGALAPA